MRALSVTPAPRLVAAAGAARGPGTRIVAAGAAPRRRSCRPIASSTSTLMPHAAAVRLCRRQRHRAAVLASASASSSSSPLSPDDVVDGSSDEAALESAALRALLLCWFATQERSVFATRCLVETCLSLYRRGVPPSAPKSTLSLACLASGGALLSEDEVQLLSSWVGLCYMTLDDVGCPRFPGANATPRAGERGGAEPASRDGGSAALAGMAGFVRTTVAAFAAGGNGKGGSSAARRLLLAQAMAGGELGGAAKFMQQNARVIILTLDAARAAGLELARPLDALEAAAAASPSPSDYDSPSAAAANAGLNGKARPTPSTERSAALSSVDDDSESDGDEESDEEGGGERRRKGSGSDEASSSSTSSLFDRPAGFAAVALPAPPPTLLGYRPVTPVERTRGVAATLLLAFLGARLNSAFSLNAFVETVAAEYRAGRAAAALLAPLTDEEMASVGADAGLKVVAPSKAARGGGGRGEEEEEGREGGERRNDAAAAADDDAAPPAATVATAGSGAAAAGRALLSQWVSIAFMTMAQMGVPHALSKSPGAQGWAFAGGSFSSSSSSSSAPASSSSSSSLSPSEAAAEALALDRLVRATLRQLAEEQGVPSAPPSETLEAFKRSAAQRAKEEAEESGGAPSASAAASFMRISDPSLASTSSALEVWGMALGVSRATAEHVAAKAEEWGLLEDGDDDGGQGGNGKGGGDGDGGGDGNGNGASSSSASSSSSGSTSSFGSSSSPSSEMAAAGEQQS